MILLSQTAVSPFAIPAYKVGKRDAMVRRTQPTIVILMIAMAIILAAGVLLTIVVIQNRSANTGEEAGAPAFTVAVGEEAVNLQVDPALRPQVVGQPAAESPRVEEEPTEEVIVDPGPAVVEEVQESPTATTAPPAATAVPSQAAQKVIFTDYTVQQGDTLYSIANRIDTSIALMAKHDISQEDLVSGNVISLPIGNPAYCPGRRPYAVKEGETAYSIAKRFNITHQELQAINGLGPDFTVNVADILCVP